MVWASDIALTLILYDLMLTQKFSCDKVNQKKGVTYRECNAYSRAY